MKTLKKVLAFLICACIFLGLASCKKDPVQSGDDNQSNKSLTISVYDGGYGIEWAKNLGNKFSQLKGVIVDVKGNVDLLPSLSSDLESSDTDIYISHGIPFQTLAAEGKLENLDGLYDSEVENGVKFKDRIVDSALGSAFVGGHYYKVPWTQGAGGIVYNVKMFEENGWGVPTVYSNPSNPECKTANGEVGLVELCALINASDVTVKVDGKDQKVTPFIWPGVDQWLWDYIFYEWWGQLAGTDVIANFLKYETAEVFNPDGNLGYKEFEKAYKYWYDLVALHPEYSAPGCEDSDKYTAQTRFTNGWAAMMPNAHWLNNEIKRYAPDGFTMAMIPAPTLPDAKKGYEKINFAVGFGDSIIVSRKSRNKNLAKEFLLFMAKEENCRAFSEDVPGTSLAFKYDIDQCAKDNVFAQSVAKMHKDCVSFNIYSSAQIAVKLGTEVLNPWPNNEFYYRASYQNPTANTPSGVVDGIYDAVKLMWPNWSIQ